MQPDPAELPGTAESQAYPDAPDAGRIRAWNNLFHSVYARRLDAMTDSLGKDGRPVLVRIGNDLVLCHAGKRSSRTVAPANYHHQKALCHVPLAITIACEDLFGTDISPGHLQSVLQAYQQSLQALEATGAGMQIRDASLAFLANIARHKSYDAIALRRYADQVREPSNRLIAQSSEQAVSELDNAVEHFEQVVNDEADWASLYCIVCSAHQPRYQELSMQFFRQYLKNRNIGDAYWSHRLVYGENIDSTDAALRLIAQRIVDEELAAIFRGSPIGLDQDVLGHAASVALNRRDTARSCPATSTRPT